MPYFLAAPPPNAPGLAWDKAAVREDIDGLLQGRRTLRERICPTNEREVELAKTKPLNDGTYSSRLEEKAVKNLESALGCLSNGTALDRL